MTREERPGVCGTMSFLFVGVCTLASFVAIGVSIAYSLIPK